MYNDIIDIKDVKQYLEVEVEFINNHTNDDEVKDSLERIRHSYFILYNIANNTI